MRDTTRPWAAGPALTATLTGLIALGCGQAPQPETQESGAAVSPEAEPKLDDGAVTIEPAQAVLRTGTAQPAVEPALSAEASNLVVAEANPRDGGSYLRVELTGASGINGSYQPRVHVPGALALYENSEVLIRWPRGQAVPETIEGQIYYASSQGGWNDPDAWHVRSFEVARPEPDPAPAGGEPAPGQGELAPGQGTLAPVVEAWASRLESQLGSERTWEGPRHPWFSFARGRMAAIVRSQSDRQGATAVALATNTRQTDLAQLMDTTTASLSIQEALQHDRGLRLGWGQGASDVPIAELPRIDLESHPFADMQRQLPKPDAATPEPMAAHAPAQFWYVRFTDIRVFLRTLDEADAWGTPIQHVLQEDPSDRGLSRRYQDQLGLGRTELARHFGHAVVDRLAVVGSDPYVREGSDLTMMFEVSNAAMFDEQLAKHMQGLEERIPGVSHTSEDYEGVTIDIARDPSGRVRQHRARLGNLHLVSNSPAAIRDVIDTSAGRGLRLADEPDFRYMLARDPGEHDALAFLSDRFIAAVIGPEQKVLQSRRQRALAELMTPGFAALSYGWLHGEEPASTEALIEAGLLDSEELVHGDGEAIVFEPGVGAHSTWGEPAMLTPLIDRPPLIYVSEAERRAYQRFADGYAENWTQFIDPVAMRLDLDTSGPRARAEFDVRVLPLIENSDYDEIIDIVGDERVRVPALGSGVQAVWAVGDTRLREELNGSAKRLSGVEGIGIDWLGSWVMVGALDRPSLLEAARVAEVGIQLPKPVEVDSDRAARELAEARRFGALPVYAAAAVASAPALVATLAALRGVANDIAPGMVDWKEHSRHGEVAIVRIGISPTAPDAEARAMSDAIALYYAQIDGAFVLALDPAVIAFFIDRSGDARALPSEGKGEEPQFVVETRARADGAMQTALSWLMQGQANRSQASARASAQALLRGAPSASDPARFEQLASLYFGGVPVSASGHSDFSLAPDGVHDAVHGSLVTPTYPELPVEGAPISVLLSRLEGVRAEVAFDVEPGATDGARSLHTHFVILLGPE